MKQSEDFDHISVCFLTSSSAVDSSVDLGSNSPVLLMATGLTVEPD